MEIKVFWSDTALSQLEDIYNYYKAKATITIARKLRISRKSCFSLNPLRIKSLTAIFPLKNSKSF